MMRFSIQRQNRSYDDFLDSLKEELSNGVRGLAEEMAEDARVRVLEQRNSGRPLPSLLADSIGVERNGLEAEVRATASYAPYVEFGTRRMEAQPFLGPAAENIRAVMATRLATELQKMIKGMML